MARKLKVYAADIDGVHEWIVAAPNQADALAAFGVNQNLFQQGLARTTDEPAAVEAAAAQPLVPLRRIKGANGGFKPADAGGGEAWEKAAKAAGVKPGRKKPKPRDRAKIERAKAELENFEADAREEVEALERAAETLERRREALREAQADRRERLRAELEKACRSVDAHS